MADGQRPGPGSWAVISGERSGRAILIVDFPAQHRREADFPELVARLGTGYRFLRSKPPVARPCQRLSSAAYASPWIEHIRKERYPVRAMLGYGVGCVYAAAIADGISRWQQEPKIILFDPQLPSAELLSHEFSREIRANYSLLSDEEIRRSREIASAIAESAARNVADVAVEVMDGFLDIITAAFERTGLGAARDSALTASFESYISWMSVAGQIDPGLAWSRSVAIVSADHEGRPGRMPRSDDRSRVARQIPFPVRRADLLRCDPVARMVVDLLGL
jgi:hypothetical protein